jgi:hypothetical protein
MWRPRLPALWDRRNQWEVNLGAGCTNVPVMGKHQKTSPTRLRKPALCVIACVRSSQTEFFVVTAEENRRGLL